MDGTDLNGKRIKIYDVSFILFILFVITENGQAKSCVMYVCQPMYAEFTAQKLQNYRADQVDMMFQFPAFYVKPNPLGELQLNI